MHRICIARALHLLCICIESGKYCHPDIAKPPLLGVSVPKITLSKNHVFMQRSNAAMHMECICIALVMHLHYVLDFQCVGKSDFSLIWTFLHVHSTCNAFGKQVQCICIKNIFLPKCLLY